MKKKHYILLFLYTYMLILFCIKNFNAQQDPKTSMYMFSQLNLNPAYAGSKRSLITSMQLRNQWLEIPGAPKTSIFTLNASTKKEKVGWGIQTFSDEIGPKKITGLLGSYAYHLGKQDKRLSMGLRLGAYNYTYNWAAIEYRDKNDMYNTGEQSSRLVFTTDAGIYYYTQTWYSGLSFTHLNQDRIVDTHFSDKELAQLKIHSYLTFGKGFQINENLILSPSFLVRHSPAATSLDLNFNVLLMEKLWLGASFRSMYGYALLIQVPIGNKFKFGYSYDKGQNRIGKVGGASHELLIQYAFNIFRSKIISPRFL